ncbi:MAG: oxygen-insensitive NAD(P)H nitroreductase/dihydropteridine reductase [Inoviridae sp.]|nr:MAG: oxygen-insensitive NAD(P)H nitroreductase/dihydropteridine reductase [Inoviridae sp.]
MLSDTDRRPCHKVGKDPTPCALAHYRRVIDNHVRLHGPWAGWRLAGRDLVSPDGDRINPQRLRGLLFRQAAEARIARAKVSTVQPIVLPARERFGGSA